MGFFSTIFVGMLGVIIWYGIMSMIRATRVDEYTLYALGRANEYAMRLLKSGADPSGVFAIYEVLNEYPSPDHMVANFKWWKFDDFYPNLEENLQNSFDEITGKEPQVERVLPDA